MKTERQKIMEAVLVIAEHYDKKLSKTSLIFFADALGEFVRASQIEDAFRQHLQGPNGRFFPSPGDLLSLIFKYQTVQEAANESLARVVTAVSRFGYIDPAGAKKFLGDLIWDALPGEVGWHDFCMSGENVSQSTARAQLRDRIAAKLHREFPTGQVKLPPPGNVELRTLLPWPDQIVTEEDRREEMLKFLKGGTDDNRIKE